MKRFIINTLFGVCVVLMACGTARAQTCSSFWQTLTQTNGIPCGDTYVLDNGFFIFGVNNPVSPGLRQDIAWPFVSQNSGPVRQVNLLLTNTGSSGPGGIVVGLYTDSCGGLGAPTTLLGRVKVAAASGIANTTHCNFSNLRISLTLGTRYWVVVSTDDTDNRTNGTVATWWAPMSSVYAIGNIDAGDTESVTINGPGGFAVTP